MLTTEYSKLLTQSVGSRWVAERLSNLQVVMDLALKIIEETGVDLQQSGWVGPCAALLTFSCALRRC